MLLFGPGCEHFSELYSIWWWFRERRGRLLSKVVRKSHNLRRPDEKTSWNEKSFRLKWKFFRRHSEIYYFTTDARTRQINVVVSFSHSPCLPLPWNKWDDAWMKTVLIVVVSIILIPNPFFIFHRCQSLFCPKFPSSLKNVWFLRWSKIVGFYCTNSAK